MKRQQAFAKEGKFLKGGLHCHTTRSDGRGDPAEVIRLYKQNGYDFLALTDHRNYNYENFAPETGLTIIPGMEFDNPFHTDDDTLHHFHIVCIGPAKADGNGYEQDERCDSGTAQDQMAFQPYLDAIHAKKNLTVYCHPEWSKTPAPYFEKMQGNFAMEIWNSISAIRCGLDTDAAYWDDLLGQGIRIWGVASDDGHDMEEHCHGWVRVKAEDQQINTILAALEDGAFYSSCGPEIHDFWADDEKIVIECSPCTTIRLFGDGHPTQVEQDADGNLTRAEFSLSPVFGPYRYVRATVIDKDGKKAWTNPIFFD